MVNYYFIIVFSRIIFKFFDAFTFNGLNALANFITIICISFYYNIFVTILVINHNYQLPIT